MTWNGREIPSEVWNEVIDDVRRLCVVVGVKSSDVEDIAQEACLAVFKRNTTGLFTYKTKQELLSFFKSTVFNIHMNRWRAKQRHPEGPIPEGDGIVDYSEWDCGPLLDDSEVQRIRRAVRELPPLMQEAVNKRIWEGKKPSEIALECGVTTSTIGTRLHRANQLLRNLLAGFWND